MSLLRGVVLPAVRSDATSDLVNPRAWLLDLGGRKTHSGETVTASSAMGLSAYYASIRNIAEDLAKLPLNLYKRRATRGADIQYDHDVHRLLRHKPNPLMGSYEFRRLLGHRALGEGNGLAEIVRDSTGRPVALWPIETSRVRPELVDDGQRLVYHVSGTNGTVTLQSRDVFHIKGLGSGVWGYSVVQYASETLGLGLAAQAASARFFGDGMAHRLVAAVKDKMSDVGRAGLRKRIQGDDENDPDGVRKIPIVEGDVTLTNWGVNPEDAQFIETMQFTVEDVARWFRMALAKLQKSDTSQGWSTLELLNTDYANDALGGWAVCWEQEAWDKLLPTAEQDDHYFKHVFQALLRGDYKTRIEGYASQVANAQLTPNEARELEERNPIDDPAADMLYIQSGFVPLEDAGPPEPPAPPPLPQDDGDEPPDDEDDGGGGEDDAEPDERTRGFGRRAMAARHVFRDAAARVLAKQATLHGRALKRHAGNAAAYDAWAVGFRETQEREVVCAFAAAAESMADLWCADGGDDRRAHVRGALAAWAREYARGELLRVSRDGPSDESAGHLADAVLRRVLGALRVEVKDAA